MEDKQQDETDIIYTCNWLLRQNLKSWKANDNNNL